MADIFDTKKRSEIMRSIKSSGNLSTEQVSVYRTQKTLTIHRIALL